MEIKEAFDSGFCNVRYIESDNVVLLTWKKPAHLEDYRKPTLFASALLAHHPHSNFVIDATNGFEDDKADVAWGISELLPGMAKTDCKYVIFILRDTPAIEEEMDMWAREFGKYFAVIKAESYAQAIEKMHCQILLNVRYTIKPGQIGAFLTALNQEGIIAASKAEPGNAKYDYYIPVGLENTLLLIEIWVDAQALAAHLSTAHYQQLQALKKAYVTDVAIEKYYAESSR